MIREWNGFIPDWLPDLLPVSQRADGILYKKTFNEKNEK